MVDIDRHYDHTIGDRTISRDAPNALTATARLCLDALDELTAALVVDVQSIEPYSSGLVPESELYSDAEASLELVLREIGSLPVPRRLLGTRERIGQRRALVGVPADILMRAVRLDFRVLWNALEARTAARDQQTLSDSTVRVWEIVEEHSSQIHAAYLAEAAIRARSRKSEQTRLLDYLLATEGSDQHLVGQVATALGVDGNGLFAVATSPLQWSRQLVEASARIHVQPITTYTHHLDGCLSVFIQLPKRDQKFYEQWLDGVACALVSDISGLAGLPASVRISIEIAKTIRADATGPTRLSDAWAAVAARRMLDLRDVLRSEVLPAHDSASEDEIGRLVETAHAYCRLGGINDVAAELFCHRNTVQNRLRQFAALTGRSLAHPADAAAVMLALEMDRLSDRTSEIPGQSALPQRVMRNR